MPPQYNFAGMAERLNRKSRVRAGRARAPTADWTQSRQTTGYQGAAHPGVDLAVAVGTRIDALRGGRVVAIDRNPNAWPYGYTVRVKSPGGQTIRYSHLSEFARGLSVGDVVKVGQTLAKSGGGVGTAGAGRTTGPHIDVGIYDRENRPMNTGAWLAANVGQDRPEFRSPGFSPPSIGAVIRNPLAEGAKIGAYIRGDVLPEKEAGRGTREPIKVANIPLIGDITLPAPGNLFKRYVAFSVAGGVFLIALAALIMRSGAGQKAKAGAGLAAEVGLGLVPGGGTAAAAAKLGGKAIAAKG